LDCGWSGAARYTGLIGSCALAGEGTAAAAIATAASSVAAPYARIIADPPDATPPRSSRELRLADPQRARRDARHRERCAGSIARHLTPA
jgi:hypothetical protein